MYCRHILQASCRHFIGVFGGQKKPDEKTNSTALLCHLSFFFFGIDIMSDFIQQSRYQLNLAKQRELIISLRQTWYE